MATMVETPGHMGVRPSMRYFHADRDTTWPLSAMAWAARVTHGGGLRTSAAAAAARRTHSMCCLADSSRI